MNQRSSPRFPLETTALLWLEENNSQRTIRTRTKDISRTGLYLYGDFKVNPAFKFAVQLPPPIGGKDGGLMRGDGRFVRYDFLDHRRIGFAATIEQFQMVLSTTSKAGQPARTKGSPNEITTPAPRLAPAIPMSGVELEDYIGCSIRVSGPMFGGPVMLRLLAAEPDRIYVSDGSDDPPFWVPLAEIKIG